MPETIINKNLEKMDEENKLYEILTNMITDLKEKERQLAGWKLKLT